MGRYDERYSSSRNAHDLLGHSVREKTVEMQMAGHRAGRQDAVVRYPTMVLTSSQALSLSQVSSLFHICEAHLNRPRFQRLFSCRLYSLEIDWSVRINHRNGKFKTVDHRGGHDFQRCCA